MAITSSELSAMKSKVEKAKVDYDRAVGRMEAIKEQLKAEGFANLQELADEVSRLHNEREKLKAYLEQEVAHYKVTYEDILK